MSFGDWEMFKVTLIQLREYEIASILRQDEMPVQNTKKPERKGMLYFLILPIINWTFLGNSKASTSGVDKADSKMQTELPRERKQSVMEKQVG